MTKNPLQEPAAALEPERVYAELEKARDRIGHTADEAMRWLLRFAALDLDRLSAGDWLNTQYDVLALGKFGIPRVTPIQPFMPLHYGLATGTVLHPDKVRAVHTTARAGVEKVLDRGIPVWNVVSLEFLLLPEPVWTLMAQGEFDTTVSYTLAHLFAQTASRIRRCPQCQKVHLADRDNKFYCSTRCQSLAGTRRFRQAHGLISGRPRGRPRKEDSHAKRGRAASQHARTKQPGRKVRPNTRRR